MKVRLVEYRVRPNRGIQKSGREKKLASYDNPLDYTDPGVTDGWQPLAVSETLEIRSRMFYNVEAISKGEHDKEIHQASTEREFSVPGRPIELHIRSGGSIQTASAVIAETEEEISPA